MAACETCWAEASRRAAYAGASVVDIYPKVLAENQPWSPEAKCGGISVNGAPWVWCEAHMQPRGHFDAHPHDRLDVRDEYGGIHSLTEEATDE